MANQMRTISAARIGDVLCVRIVPEALHELDLTPLQHDILAAARDAGAGRIVIDFERVAYLPTTVLGVLLKCQKMIEADGGRLHLAAMTPRVKHVFVVSDLVRVLSIFDTCDDAVRAFERVQ
jgi:anti-anti-sigma factor